MKISFFSRPKPRSFNYRPVYYDPVKEETEERKKSLGYLQSDDHRERIRTAFRKRLKNNPEEVDKQSQVIRFFVYVIFAAFGIYLIFFTDFIPRMVSLFVR